MEEVEILTDIQKKFLRLFGDSGLVKDYYLTGGTALSAHYLKHRYSEDLDFFAQEAAPLENIERFCIQSASKLGLGQPTLSRLYDRRIFTFQNGDLLKVEFTEYPYPPLAEKSDIDGVKVDSLRDIAANKLMAVIDRFESKDYIDLAVIVNQMSIEEIATDAERKFRVRIEPLTLGARLMLAENIAVMPRLLIDLTKEDVVKQLTAEAEKLRRRVLDG